MAFELPRLPYPEGALAPFLSAETINYHYGKHHKAYVDNLNRLTSGTEFENLSLEEVIKKAGPGAVFNNAAQVWNHTFYWRCLKPGGGEPSGELRQALEKSFGSLEAFKEAFTKCAVTHFGSGWAWLVKSADGSLEVLSTPNAETPLAKGQKPLLTCDVWEHAYYIDYRNDRAKYVNTFWDFVNWEFVAENLASQG